VFSFYCYILYRPFSYHDNGDDFMFRNLSVSKGPVETEGLLEGLGSRRGERAGIEK